MIHADYKVGGGIVIKRYDDRYEIENPGTLLVSQEQLRRGGVSECRNKSLQRMFMLIGVGEQAGSGFARIQDGWKDQHWRAPRLIEQHGPDRVRLDMPMVSLMPQWAFDALRQKIGSAFQALSQPAQIALATAMIEGEVTNTRMQDLVPDHPSDITKLLRGLVGKDLLETDNQRRWTRYSLPSAIAPRRDLFSTADSTALPGDSVGLPGNSTGLQPDSLGLDAKATELKSIADRVSGKGKVPKAVMETTILELCQGRFLTLAELASLLDRSAPNLRTAYLTPLLQAGRLRHRYPDQPNRPDQAYTSTETR
jgi:ATP-dependent DNA helicase RecG